MEYVVWLVVLAVAGGLAYWKVPAFKAFVDKMRGKAM